MRLAWNRDTKTLSCGAAAAAVLGVMLGGAMRPDFGDDGRPAGPQMIAGWAGMRSTGPFDPGTTLASYGGQVPDYVMGTDAKKAMSWPDERAAVSEPPRRRAVDADDPPAGTPEDWAAPVTRTAFEDLPAPRSRYPSLDGGAGPEPEDDEAPADAG